MGRRRWRFIAIAAFLLGLSRNTLCQDEDIYYTPVERSFAQLQPPLFPNNRPATYFERGDGYRVAQNGLNSNPQQPLFNEGHARFPSPNYNQNPSPFQLPTGRSQSADPYYLNQADYASVQQSIRPSFPHNFQLVHPASTRRPDTQPIHSAAYQNDPSKPETFLGQITLNNPDIDYLQSGRFKNTAFEGNSLKGVSHHNHGHPNDEDFDEDHHDVFENHKVTTYNPNRLLNKQRLSIKPNTGSRPLESSIETSFVNKTIDNVQYSLNNKDSIPNKIFLSRGNYKFGSPTTEYKPLLDIEPLLEDDIKDITSFRELMKNTQSSFDVEVIKSEENKDDDKSLYDSNPSASSMDADNMPKEIPSQPVTSADNERPTKNNENVRYHLNITNNVNIANNSKPNQHSTENVGDELDDEGEYVEYYDEPDNTEDSHAIKNTYSEEQNSDVYDDYDTTDEIDHVNDESKNNTSTFDVLTTKPSKTMVKDDNFKQFIDTTVIDQMEHTPDNGTTEIYAPPNTSEELTSIENSETSSELDAQDNPDNIIPNSQQISSENSSILGQEVVSVVTTKSVVNGTISIPDGIYTPSTSKPITNTRKSPTGFKNYTETLGTTSIPNTTDNWIVVASVQTSRSVSGARFLPFPTVEQEEKKQVLDSDEETVTKNPKEEQVSNTQSSNTGTSTENINDKLDSIQSELSHDVLAGTLDSADKNIEHITESTSEKEDNTSSTTISPLNVFTLKSIVETPTIEKSEPSPLPVLIKKFTPRVITSTTTQKPKRKTSLVTVMDDLTGLLPPGYKPRPSYKRTTTSTTSTTSTEPTPPISTQEVDNLNGTQGRSSGISSKNKVVVTDQKQSLLPKDSKSGKETKPVDELFKIIKEDDLSKFLPPGFKLPQSTESPKESIINKIKTVDVSAFLPKNYTKTSIADKTNIDSKTLPNVTTVDISAFLPPGFKLNDSNVTEDTGIKPFKIADISNLLPPGYNSENKSETSTSKPIASNNGFKVVFPSRPPGLGLGPVKPIRKATTAKPVTQGPEQVTPKIQKGWPTRASTEFTGWPSPSTTPFSIEKLLEAQRNATATSPMPELSTEATTRRTTTTTSTTLPPPPPTTPGVCRQECDVAGTIKIVSGVKWIPELLDRNTEEWKNLANEVKDELNSVYSKSDLLRKWYKGIRIDAFSKGSVLVDYFVELNSVAERVDTLELKKLFHKSLPDAPKGSVVEIIESETNEEFDPDVMVGDQPEEDRMKKSNEKMTKTIDKSAGKLEIGKFIMDPAYTEFIVLPKREEPTIVEPEEESLLPQWGIAVIVIALASLLFVVIFGVTVLVNRQKSTKAKQPIPLSEDMLRELDKSHMGGLEDIHQLKDRDLPYLPSGKRMSTAFIEQLAYPNPGDSWRSEWTPQLQKYMQHYTPDSGRGSQIYGTNGNGYGYSGSQIYGQTGGGSQGYGYAGDYPRPHYSRRRSEYDSNF